MQFKDFPLDIFLQRKEESDKEFSAFIRNEIDYVPVIVSGGRKRYKGLNRTPEETLESQLDELALTLELHSDFMYPTFLQPWYTTDLYAVAYGCPYKWFEGMSAQSETIIKKAESVHTLQKANMDTIFMNLIIDTIKYMKRETKNTLDISVTDTQSPNDVGSEIMDACEFITLCALDPDGVEEYLTDITNTIIAFTEKQLNEIGENAVFPGHAMVSIKGVKGICLSDDNMAFLSPSIYKNTCFKFNSMISKHFGGVSLHSCGDWGHNAEQMLETENLFMVDCSMGAAVDPNPLKPIEIREAFKGKDIILKAKMGIDDIENLKDLVHPEVKLLVEIIDQGTTEERNVYYEKTKEYIGGLQ